MREGLTTKNLEIPMGLNKMTNKKLAIISSVFLSAALNVNATEMATAPLKEGGGATVQFGEKLSQEPQKFTISNYHINRIVTPFKNPSIKLDSVEGVAFKQKGSVIYISTNSSRNIGAFITEKGDESNAINLILEPKRLPPKEIILSGGRFNANIVARKFERSLPRTKTIKAVLSGIAKGEIPTGYVQESVNAMYLPVCSQDGLNFDFYSGQFFSGGDYVVSVGVVKNTSSKIIELKENKCFREGIVAISAFPKTTLGPNDKAEVFVMFQRERVSYKETRSTRKSLIK